jgi:hypothetical protein
MTLGDPTYRNYGFKLKGRLVDAYTNSACDGHGGIALQMNGSSYDADGHPTDMWERLIRIRAGTTILPPHTGRTVW